VNARTKCFLERGLNKVIFLKIASSRMLRRVAFVKNDVSEELNTSIIGVTRIGELGTALVATDIGCYLLLTLFLAHRFLSP
jgi:hypothetical protein